MLLDSLRTSHARMCVSVRVCARACVCHCLLLCAMYDVPEFCCSQILAQVLTLFNEVYTWFLVPVCYCVLLYVCVSPGNGWFGVQYFPFNESTV